MKKTLILSILVGIMLLGAMALADENWPTDDPAQVAAVILHTDDAHVAFQDNIGYDGLALYKKELEAQYDHVLLIDAGDAIQGAPMVAVPFIPSEIELDNLEFEKEA